MTRADKSDKLVEVHRAANEMEAQVIKSMLDSYGIQCMLRSNAPPLALMGAYDSSAGVKILCLDSEAERARELIKGDSNV